MATYPTLSYPAMVSSTPLSLPISTYIPPVQGYESGARERETAPITTQSRPTAFTPVEREPSPSLSAPPNAAGLATPSGALVVPIPYQTSPVPPSPGIGAPHPDMEHDLPPELLQQGWRKFWSKRENRIYY